MNIKTTKTTFSLASVVLLSACIGQSESELRQFIAQCKADYDIGSSREIDYARFETPYGCADGADNEFDATAMLRKAGVCPISVESRPNGCGENAQYFVAKVGSHEIKLAEKLPTVFRSRIRRT